MARSELRANLKFRKLMRALKLPPPYVVGLLECMWQVCYQSGNDELGNDDDVELAAEWPGKRGSFFEAVRAIGFIDQRGPMWCVHDLEDHAPDYVKKKLRRRQEERSLSNKELGEKTASNGSKTASNGCGTQYTQYTQPNTPNPIPPAAAVELPEGFANFWKEWPDHFRKKGRSKCLKLWIAKKLEPMASTIVAAVKRWKKSDQWSKDGGQFLPGPHPWLSDEAWEAPVAKPMVDEEDDFGTDPALIAAVGPLPSSESQYDDPAMARQRDRRLADEAAKRAKEGNGAHV